MSARPHVRINEPFIEDELWVFTEFVWLVRKLVRQEDGLYDLIELVHLVN